MQKHQESREPPSETLNRLHRLLTNGGNLLLESLSDQELAAMQTLIGSGDAEIVSSACRPYLRATVDKIIV